MLRFKAFIKTFICKAKFLFLPRNILSNIFHGGAPSNEYLIECNFFARIRFQEVLRFCLKYSSVDFKPSSRLTFGSQLRISFARVMLG